MKLKQPEAHLDSFGNSYCIGVGGYCKIRVDPVGGFIRTKRWIVKDASGLNTYTYFNCQDAIAKGIDLYNEHVAELLEMIVEPEVTSPECTYSEGTLGTLGSYIQDVQRGVPLGTTSNT